MEKKIVVLYHDKCRDGFGAAWAAWKKFKNQADYIGVEYHLPPPKSLRGKELYILDFSYHDSVMQKLQSVNQRMVVIEHHVSREEFVKKLPEHVFSVDHSGAVLAWKYFHPGTTVPKLLQYIQEEDLWKFRMPYTREIILNLTLSPKNFRVWDRIARGLEHPRARARWVKDGTLLLRYQRAIVEGLVAEASPVLFEGYSALAVNNRPFRSEIGNALLERGAKLAIIWHQSAQTVLVSLRSRGDVDVSKLAEKYGGGGHRAAAGFNLRAGRPLPWKFFQKK